MRRGPPPRPPPPHPPPWPNTRQPPPPPPPTQGGRDNGEPVRNKAGPLSAFLADANAIRAARNETQDQNNSIGPPVGAEDYAAPVKEKPPEVVAKSKHDSRALVRDRVCGRGAPPPPHPRPPPPSPSYGSAAGQTLAAGFSIEQVPGMYEGRPDRFFDDANDPRNSKSTEDSHITRNRLAPDLLDMDFGGGGGAADGGAAALPVQNLQQSLQEQQMAQQLKEQQAQLEMLRAQVGDGGGGGEWAVRHSPAHTHTPSRWQRHSSSSSRRCSRAR